MGRPYTGFDQIAGGKRAGFETFIDLLEAHFGLWNNGTFGVRKKRGKSSYSVHATGRAGDLSWRGAPYRGPGNYQAAVKMMDFLAAHADELFVEAIFDYYPAPHGRGWKCDRAAWQVYNKAAFSGAPGGDWVHVEVSNAKADDPQYYIDTMKRLLGDPPKPVAPAPAQKTQVPPPNKSPWFQRGSKGEGVKEVQRIVGAEPVDGDFGPKTEAAVKAWQAEHDLYVDGIWGPSCERHAKSLANKRTETAGWRTFIDISKWQGSVNFATMKQSGVDALYMRAFQGMDRDIRVDEYAAGAKAHNIPFGVYIYWRPGHDLNQQITQFADTHRNLGASLIPMLDIEHDDGKSPEEIGEQVNRAVAEIERLLGVSPVIYTAAWFWNPKVRGANVSRCPLWLARYTKDKPPVNPADWPAFATARPEPAIPSGGWSSWDAWQFSADGNHAGRTYGASSSHLDLNILREESWDRFQIHKLENSGAAPKPVNSVKIAPESSEKAPEGPQSASVASSGYEYPGETIKAGSKNIEAVKLVQRKVGVKDDGQFGPVTRAAVRKWQQDNGQHVDGLVGPKTWKAMFG